MPSLQAKNFERRIKAIEAAIAGCDNEDFRKKATEAVRELKKMNSRLKEFELALSGSIL